MMYSKIDMMNFEKIRIFEDILGANISFVGSSTWRRLKMMVIRDDVAGML